MVVADDALPSLGRRSNCSAVASRDQWLNSFADRVPGLVLGLITMVATWQPTSVLLVAHLVAVPPSPSSQVMNTAVEPLAYWALCKIVGRLAASHVSPSATVPLCMSSIRFGVTKENAGSLPADRLLASRL